MRNQSYYVFYATLLYGEYKTCGALKFNLRDLPDGIYIYTTNETPNWYLRDLTPVLDEDVPKELKTLVLLMGI